MEVICRKCQWELVREVGQEGWGDIRRWWARMEAAAMVYVLRRREAGNKEGREKSACWNCCGCYCLLLINIEAFGAFFLKNKLLMPTKSPWEFSPWHAHMKSLYICLICHMHTRLEAVWGYGIDLQQVSCASREEPQVKGPELCHGIPRQRDRSVRGRARSQSLCPGLLAV